MSCQNHAILFRNHPLLNGGEIPAVNLKSFTDLPDLEEQPYLFYGELLHLAQQKNLSLHQKHGIMASGYGITADLDGVQKFSKVAKFFSNAELWPVLDFWSDYFDFSNFFARRQDWDIQFEGSEVDLTDFFSFLIMRVAQQNGCIHELNKVETPFFADSEEYYPSEWVQKIWLNPKKFIWCRRPEAVYSLGLALRLHAVSQEPLINQLKPATCQLLFQEAERVLNLESGSEKEKNSRIFLFQTVQKIAREKKTNCPPYLVELAKACLQTTSHYSGQVTLVTCEECQPEQEVNSCNNCGNLRVVVRPVGLTVIQQTIKQKFERPF